VRIESIHISKTMIFRFHPTHHQVTKSSQNTKITKLGLAPTIPRSISFSPKLFPHHFGDICDYWVHPVLQNHDFRFAPLTQQVTKSSENTKITKLGLAPTIPISIPFSPKLFQHHFGSIWEDLVRLVFKNHDFHFSPHTPPSHKIKQKHQNYQTWLNTNHTKINSFCP